MLIVEDDEMMGRALERGLQAEGYDTVLVTNGVDALIHVAHQQFSAAVVDVMLPHMSGFEICRRIRETGSTLPMLLLTARDAIEDRVTGLDSGADDYLTKPFSFAELAARIRALLRRDPADQWVTASAGNLTLDSQTRKAHVDGQSLSVSPNEFLLLRTLILRLNQPLTRQQLLAGAVFVARIQIAQVQINADKKLLYSASTPYIAQIRNHPAQIDQPAGEQRVAVLDPGGSIVASNLPAPLAARPDIFADLKSGSHFVTFAGVHYLVTVESVDRADGTWKIVASRDQQPTELVLANLTNILVGGAAVLLVGFGLASWLLTAAALRPVTQMRRRAELLRATNSAKPLPVGPAKDELAALAVTLNNFIDHVRKTAAREKQMVSDASHEIRTPLAVLKIQLELAHLSEGDAAALRGDLVRAEATVDRLSRLATSLLELSCSNLIEEQPPPHGNRCSLNLSARPTGHGFSPSPLM